MILLLHENGHFDNWPDAIGKVYRSGDFIPRIGETISIKNFKLESPTDMLKTVRIGGISMAGYVFRVHYNHDNRIHIHIRMISELDIEILKRWNKNVVNLQDYAKEDIVVFKKEDESEGSMVRIQSGIDNMDAPVCIIIPDDTCYIDPHFFTGLMGTYIDMFVKLKPDVEWVNKEIHDRYKFINRSKYNINDSLDEAIDLAIKLSAKA